MSSYSHSPSGGILFGIPPDRRHQHQRCAREWPAQQCIPTDLPLLPGTPFRCYPYLASCRLAAAALHSTRQGARRRPLARDTALGPKRGDLPQRPEGGAYNTALGPVRKLRAPACSLHSAGSNFKGCWSVVRTRPLARNAALGPEHGPWPGAPVTLRVPKGPPQCPGALLNVQNWPQRRREKAKPFTTPPRRAPRCNASGARRNRPGSAGGCGHSRPARGMGPAGERRQR
jgi:hypothetical protein